MASYLLLISSAALRTLPQSCRSHSIVTNLPSGKASLRDRNMASNRFDGRFSKTASPPSSAHVRAATKPVPLVVPVITKTLPVTSGSSSLNSGKNLVLGMLYDPLFQGSFVRLQIPLVETRRCSHGQFRRGSWEPERPFTSMLLSLRPRNTPDRASGAE